MGLTPFQEHPGVKKAIVSIAGIAEKYLDLDAIWQIAESAAPLHAGSAVQTKGQKVESPSPFAVRLSPSVRIGIIRDSAFQFYYPENLRNWKRGG